MKTLAKSELEDSLKSILACSICCGISSIGIHLKNFMFCWLSSMLLPWNKSPSLVICVKAHHCLYLKWFVACLRYKGMCIKYVFSCLFWLISGVNFEIFDVFLWMNQQRFFGTFGGLKIETTLVVIESILWHVLKSHTSLKANISLELTHSCELR